jgi:hypothetical protein
MKTNRLLFACGLLAGMTASTALVGCKSTGQGASSQPGGVSTGSKISNTATQKVELLFVQNAKDVTFENGTMTLHGVNPVTVCFADRPERMAGHMPTPKIVPMWKQGSDSFTKDPPNATLSVFTGDTVSNVVVVLRNPHISGDDLTYEVRLLEGTPPPHGACSLFIDVYAAPFAPTHFPGQAPPSYMPHYMYAGPFGPSMVPVSNAVHPAVNY